MRARIRKIAAVAALRDFVVIFCLVFSFYVVSSLQSSIVAGGICLCCVLSSKKKTRELLIMFGDKDCFLIALFPLVIIMNCCIFSAAHVSLDMSYARDMLSLFVKLILVFCAVECIYDKHKTMEYYEKIVVYIYVAQSIIQIAAFLYPPLLTFLLHFNHADELFEQSGGVRGVSLSGGSGWALGLSYGLVFIFYTKLYLLERKLGISSVAIGILLVSGVFFSGRSAYVGIIISILWFLFTTGITTRRKIAVIVGFVMMLLACLVIVLIAFRDFVNLLFEKVFPWAFEFFFSMANSGEVSTLSTNRLLEMWEERKLITPQIFLYGEGYFTDPAGHFFHRVDVGYLRNIFYWGILGAFFVYFYQIFIFKNIFVHGNKLRKEFAFWMLVYLFVLELKAMAAGFSHFTMILCVLYSLLYYKTKRTADQRTP